MRTLLKMLMLGVSILPWMETAGQSLNARVDVESRTFPSSPLLDGQATASGSIAVQPELFVEWANGANRFHAEPFVRVDASDVARTHFDLRDLYWQRIENEWELKVGITRVFWGVTESQHLVDVINQTDLVEGLNGEAKLGQPLLQLTVLRNWGTIDLFALPWFRERTFPGTYGRLRFPLEIDDEESERDARVDVAARWSHALGPVDVGLSHFFGRNREPDFALAERGDGHPVLVPDYAIMHQTGLDLQVTQGGFLWKLEARARRTRGKWSEALVGGFEYTIGDVRGTGADIGLLAEYHYDSRRQVDLNGLAGILGLPDDERNAAMEESASNPISLTPFDDDVFAGVRLAFNDVKSTSALAGIMIDRDSGSMSLSAEAQRRIGERWTVTVEGYAFANTSRADPLYPMRRDSHVQVVLSRYF